MEQNNNNKKIYPAFLVAPRKREQRERDSMLFGVSVKDDGIAKSPTK